MIFKVNSKEINTVNWGARWMRHPHKAEVTRSTSLWAVRGEDPDKGRFSFYRLPIVNISPTMFASLLFFPNVLCWTFQSRNGSQRFFSRRVMVRVLFERNAITDVCLVQNGWWELNLLLDVWRTVGSLFPTRFSYLKYRRNKFRNLIRFQCTFLLSVETLFS